MNMNMKRLLVVLAVVVLAVLGWKVDWWLPPLLKFVQVNNNLIQGLTSLAQLVLWGIGLILGLAQLWREKDALMPSNRREEEKRSVSWDDRNTELLRQYFEMCVQHDNLFQQYLQGNERKVGEYFLNSGLAKKHANGQMVLTEPGVLLCCRRDSIPRTEFHVHVKFEDENVKKDLFGSVLYLYKELSDLLEPTFQLRVGPSPAYPRVAIIEALVNLLIHRDYSENDIGYITVYPAKVEFINPGQSAYSPERLLNTPSPLRPRYTRNARLIEAINNTRLNQREGSGIIRMREELHQNGSVFPDGKPALQIRNDSEKNRFMLIIYKKS